MLAPTEVTDGVFRLGTHYINWYLVTEGDQVTVVDAAVPGYWDQLEPGLEAAGRKPGDVAAVILTHKHADHVGLAERIRAELGAPVYIHEREADDVTGDPSAPSGLAIPPGFFSNMWRPAMLSFGFHLLRSGAMKPTPVAEISTFRDGEVLDVPGRPKVIFTPGHSPGHCCFHLADRGVLFTGDQIVTRGATTGRVGAQLMSLNDDVEKARNSLVKLEGLTAGMLLPGHGEPWTGGVAEAIRAARIS